MKRGGDERHHRGRSHHKWGAKLSCAGITRPRWEDQDASRRSFSGPWARNHRKRMRFVTRPWEGDKEQACRLKGDGTGQKTTDGEEDRVSKRQLSFLGRGNPPDKNLGPGQHGLRGVGRKTAREPWQEIRAPPSRSFTGANSGAPETAGDLQSDKTCR